MRWITHQTGAIAAGLSLSLSQVSIIAAIAGSVFPDVMDQCISKFGTTPKTRQKIFNRIHRGSTHWFGWWIILFLFALTYLPALAKDVIAGFMLGGISHILLDMLTPSGIPLLPFSHKNKVSLNLCVTGHLSEYGFLAFLISLCLYLQRDLLLKLFALL